MTADKEHMVDIKEFDFNKAERKNKVEKIIKRAIEQDTPTSVL